MNQLQALFNYTHTLHRLKRRTVRPIEMVQRTANRILYCLFSLLRITLIIRHQQFCISNEMNFDKVVWFWASEATVAFHVLQTQWPNGNACREFRIDNGCDI